ARIRTFRWRCRPATRNFALNPSNVGVYITPGGRSQWGTGGSTATSGSGPSDRRTAARYRLALAIAGNLDGLVEERGEFTSEHLAAEADCRLKLRAQYARGIVDERSMTAASRTPPIQNPLRIELCDSEGGRCLYQCRQP